MADEITAQVGLALLAEVAVDSEIFLAYDKKTASTIIDQATPRLFSNVQEISSISVHEAIQMGVEIPVADQGWAYFRNLDPTNSISLGVDVAAAFKPMWRLLSGESMIVRLEPSIQIYAMCNDGAPCDLEYTILNV